MATGYVIFFMICLSLSRRFTWPWSRPRLSVFKTLLLGLQKTVSVFDHAYWTAIIL